MEIPYRSTQHSVVRRLALTKSKIERRASFRVRSDDAELNEGKPVELLRERWTISKRTAPDRSRKKFQRRDSSLKRDSFAGSLSCEYLKITLDEVFTRIFSA